MEKENIWKIKQREMEAPAWHELCEEVGSLKRGAAGKWSIWGEDRVKKLAWEKIHSGFRLVCHLKVSGVHAFHRQIKRPVLISLREEIGGNG